MTLASRHVGGIIGELGTKKNAFLSSHSGLLVRVLLKAVEHKKLARKIQ
jgi:hypothetical protein